MITRAYGRALSDHEIEDVYSAAWAAILSALRTRGSAMSNEELRAYILTAVASHASKEMRRRSRKPTGPIGAEAEQVLTDGHLPLPDEIALGTEARGVARDLLTSLPQRRRAVMLLRYGWGLSPAEVCALVPGLSPRAYRKEVTKGVEQLIDRLRLVESGEWCEAREPLVRDLVAGTADEETRLQAVEHLEHCRSCAELAARLSGHLHELGGLVAIGSVAGVVGVGKFTFADRIADLIASGRNAGSDLIDRAQSFANSMAMSGAGRGSGAIGAGAAAKVAGVGTAGKAILACVGTGAAATACVAAGVVPGVSIQDLGASEPDHSRASRPAVGQIRPATGPRRPVVSVSGVGRAVAASEVVEPVPREESDEPSHDASEPPADEPVADPPVVSPPVEEFDPVAQSAPSYSGSSPATSSGSSSSSSSAAQEEFGP